MKSLIATVLTLCIFNTGFAANFAINPGGKDSLGQPEPTDAVDEILLSGEIAPGDAERFVSALFARGRYRLPVTLYLNSMGGDVAESARIAMIVNAARLDTKVLDVYAMQAKSESQNPHVCASSCFLIYAAGERRDAPLGFGRIGIHRPYFKTGAGSLASEANVLSSAHESTSQLLKSFGVSTKLIEKMLSTPSNEVHWLSKAELDEVGFMSVAVEEIAIRDCGYSRKLLGRRFDSEAARSELFDVMSCLNKKLFDERAATMKKLKAGWRPYTK